MAKSKNTTEHSLFSEENMPTEPKPKLKLIAPFVVGGIIFSIAFLQIAGVIDIQGILNLNDAYEITPSATIGEPISYNFATSGLISLLPKESTGGPYTYYLGSGVGFPPMGLTLDINGILKGTPTGNGGKFQVCVKDVGGRSVCQNYILNVNPKKTQSSPATQNNQNKCPLTKSETACSKNTNGPSIDTVSIPLKCSCPSDMDSVGSPFTAQDGSQWHYCACFKING